MIRGACAVVAGAFLVPLSVVQFLNALAAAEGRVQGCDPGETYCPSVLIGASHSAIVWTLRGLGLALLGLAVLSLGVRAIVRARRRRVSPGIAL